jgi:hypothetical protein
MRLGGFGSVVDLLDPDGSKILYQSESGFRIIVKKKLSDPPEIT